MVELGQGAEEVGGGALLEANDEAVLSGAFDFERLDDGPTALQSVLHDLLVNGEGVV